MPLERTLVLEQGPVSVRLPATDQRDGRPVPSAAVDPVARPGSRGPAWSPRLIWFLATAGAWLAGGLYLTQITTPPGSVGPEIDDTVAHFGLGILIAGTLLCVVQAWDRDGRRLVPATLTVAAFSAAFLIATELLQMRSSVRQPGVTDAVADLGGVALATVIMLLLFIRPRPLPDRAANLFAAGATLAIVLVAVAAILAAD